ncbi:XrtA system polysaccharide deacetylase [Halorhodospira neutriphila]|uniref:Polysaccharide deacetylase family protein n=1 Tax=Halorhodospira neutriphila TaxID=168379 RepID=A0ABS1E641_9GAMM|nr:XrtA system polysaccharide deacetylase [Halorhodospira neutriphila]MBK1726965.1 polysaccharide deacetylase family protein [Halorhodospira neutriphila]
MSEHDGSPRNALTVDVEDYFQVLAMAPYVPREQWGRWGLRVEASLERLLELCEEAGARATFFTLGWIAERCPQAVRRIAEAGHELASHGYGHERVGAIGPAAFREDIHRAKGLLEDTAGVEVLGYRAPGFSMGPHTPWAPRLLRAAGHRYSSSVYPIRHDHYGAPRAPRHPHRLGGAQGVLEIPPATVRLAGRNWPAAGGGYFRLLPYAASRLALRRINRREGRAAVFYIHPWELDPGQPRIPGVDLKTRLRHYLNLGRTEGRLRRLLHELPWGRIDHVFAAELAAGQEPVAPARLPLPEAA